MVARRVSVVAQHSHRSQPLSDMEHGFLLLMLGRAVWVSLLSLYVGAFSERDDQGRVRVQECKDATVCASASASASASVCSWKVWWEGKNEQREWN